jgi:hypothetical protein
MHAASLPVPTLGEALTYLRTHGVGGAWHKLLTTYLFGRDAWYVTIEDLSQWVGAPVECSEFEIRAATLADIDRMTGLMARQHEKTLRAWCRHDHYFFIALANGEAVSYRCLSRRVHAAVNRIVTLRPQQLFMVDEYTVPAFRRRGITRQLAIVMNPLVFRAGFREVVGIHWTDNENTRAATRAKGIATIGMLTRVRRGRTTQFTYESFGPTLDAPLSPDVRQITADAPAARSPKQAPRAA